MTRILIIEDEHKTADYLKKGFKESGFIVDVARNGEDGLHFAVQYMFDLIILDISLPKLNGFQVISALRKENLNVKVIILSAHGDTEDKVKGLELGADDYLSKPFMFSELLARVRCLLRRGAPQTQDILTIDDLVIDVVKHKVFRNSLKIDLSPKEFLLLLFLVQRKGEVLSRTLIAEKVWDIHFDSDTNVIDVAIKRLRQKIDGPFEKKLIHTIRGMGYLLEEMT